MSNSEPSSRHTATRSNPDSFVLPQWGVELMRPVFGSLGRRVWSLALNGLENIPSQGGLVVAANHQSYIDPFLISVPIKIPMRYLAWNVALDWFFVGRVMQFLGAWPLQLEGSDPAAIRRSLQWLRNGRAVMIFPEGGRGQPDGSMARFKVGAVRIALEAGVPILPVTIQGANIAWPVDKRLPRKGRIEITYHPIFKVEQKPDEEARACARRESERLFETIHSALE